MVKSTKKESDTDKKIRLMNSRIKKLENKLKELEVEIKKKDLDEITEIQERLNMPASK